MVVTTTPRSLARDVSPPRPAKRKRRESPRCHIVDEITKRTTPDTHQSQEDPRNDGSSIIAMAAPTPAQVEAGHVAIADHLTYFSAHFLKIIASRQRKKQLPLPPATLPIAQYSSLFTSHAGRTGGQHFVVHQHDHPVAGLHYDLRLQINEDSSVSWSVPYGLPGNPNERRRYGRRQCIETRIHTIWNHLVESASDRSGSTLIWDTGSYEVLPYRKNMAQMTDDDEDDGDDEAAVNSDDGLSTTQSLSHSFATGKIRVRLNGSKLPPGYTIKLSRTSQRTLQKIDPLKANRSLRGKDPNSTNPTKTPLTPRRRRARRGIQKEPEADPASDRDESDADVASVTPRLTPSPSVAETQAAEDIAQNNDSDDDYEQEQEAIRRDNAYTGAHNTVGSVRGRWWIIYLDKAGCGLTKGRDSTGRAFWSTENEQLRQRYPFYVRGREVECSVVTGRKASDVLEDGSVTGFVPRYGWQPVLN